MQNLRSLGTGKLMTYGLIAFASGEIIRRGVRYFKEQKLAKDKASLQHDDDAIDLASEDSFPASDPPSYTRRATGRVH